MIAATACVVIAAYLLGGVPFAYLLVRWRKGIDIRTVGSGNVGATNAGRLLGFRYFLLIFALDVLKGFLPTWGLPRLVAAWIGEPGPAALPVLVGLGTILGHNFPVYLRFRGGKGVATSLGAFAALEPFASAGALLSFLVALAVTRYVSLSSIVGALAFVLAYFSRAADPWGLEIVRTLVIIVLVGMLIVRHRQNFVRIARGTEPKVALGRKKPPPAGRVGVALLVALAALVAGAGTWFARHARRVEVLDAGAFTLQEVNRAGTGLQRATRLAFCDDGQRLALLCPRYERLVLFAIGPNQELEVAEEVELDGRPMALAVAESSLYVLQRPASDQRHVEPGWVEALDFQGAKRGPRFLAGHNPDDLALTPDGETALVITGERTSGDGQPPPRFLQVVALKDGPREVARVDLGRWEDEPGRIHLARSGLAAMIAVPALGTAVAVDLSDPRAPRRLGESPLPRRDLGYPSTDGADQIVMPVASPSETIALDGGDAETMVLVGTRPSASAIEVVGHRAGVEMSLGKLRLRGPFNLGDVRPTSLAWSAERNLLAVATKSGAVHLVALTPRSELAETARERR